MDRRTIGMASKDSPAEKESNLSDDVSNSDQNNEGKNRSACVWIAALIVGLTIVLLCMATFILLVYDLQLCRARLAVYEQGNAALNASLTQLEEQNKLILARLDASDALHQALKEDDAKFNKTLRQMTSRISFVNERLIEMQLSIEALNQSQMLADAQLQYSIDAKTAQLSLEVNNTRALMHSTASEIRDETAGEVRSLQAYINDTADHLKTEVEREIRDTADDLHAAITAHNESLSAHISQGISGLRAEIDSEIGLLNATVVHQYQQTWFAIDVLNQTQISTKTQILSAIDARTTELSEDVDNLKSQVNSTATEIQSELHHSVGQLQTSITGVKTELETDIQGVSDNLKATEGTLSNDITQLRSNINGIKTDIRNIKSDVTDLKTSDCSRYSQCNPGSSEPDDACISTASIQLLLLFALITVFCF